MNISEEMDKEQSAVEDNLHNYVNDCIMIDT